MLTGDHLVPDFRDPLEICQVIKPFCPEVVNRLLNKLGELLVKCRVLLHLFSDHFPGGMGDGVGLSAGRPG
ncbi:MAG: hypothetical protein A4E62_02975 [Syntrophorhabdus sp. PtaU1.Bin002]|nr:MAG: hypothetical protein A4E62_02975 [Syntrophorhabdus sp. PtaU1.Bin002]